MKTTLVLLTLIVAVLSISSLRPSTKPDYVEKFERFVNDFGKEYDQDEYELRLKHFKASLDRIEQRNRRAKGKTTFGVTKFSDLSTKEFKDLYLTANVPAFERRPDVSVLEPTVAVEDLPTALDWRKKNAVTAVKDQGQCGSCWAFSVTENIESMWILAGKAKADSLALAPQQIVDCDESDEGCNGGNTGPAFDYVISAGGLESEKDYPYMALNQDCAFQSNETVAKIKTWQYATSWYSETELKQNLVSWGPLSVCVDAASWQDYVSGVLTWEECAWINLLDHCVQLVGYGTDPKAGNYWIVRNSWGTSWGLDGYIHIQMGEDACGIAHQATSAVI